MLLKWGVHPMDVEHPYETQSTAAVLRDGLYNCFIYIMYNELGHPLCRSGLDDLDVLNNYINGNMAEGSVTDYEGRQE